MTNGTSAAAPTAEELIALQRRADLARLQDKPPSVGSTDPMSLSRLVVKYVVGRQKRREIEGSTTAKGYRYTLLAFARFVNDRRPAKVNRRHVERWLEDLNVTAATARGMLSMVAVFFDWCVTEGYCQRNPARGLGKIKVPQPLPRAVPHDGVTATLSAAPDDRARLIISLMVQEGLRAKEVAGVEAGDVDPVRRSLLVRQGKGGKERVVPLSKETAEILAGYVAVHPAKGGPLIRSYLNPTKGVSAAHVSNLVSRWMHEAGVAESGHALRHTAASDLLDSGTHVRNVQYFLGHTSLNTTQRYLRLQVGDLQRDMPERRYRRPMQAEDGQ